MTWPLRVIVSELLGANTDLLDRHAESLRTDAQRVQDIRTLAQRAMAELQASWTGPDLMQLTQQWEHQVSPLLAGASTSLDACAAQLRAQSVAQRAASSSDGGGPSLFPTGMPLAAMPVTPPASPPKAGTPADNALWWRSLSPQQQEQVLSQHPDWIGNRDGVPFTARDDANRALLSVNRNELEAERERLQADLDDHWFGGVFTNDDAALDHVKDKLASLDAIEKTLTDENRPGRRQLLLLDMSQERAQAAIARGNVDTADNVAVFVPGLAANVTDSMEGYDANMDDLNHRAELESKRVNAVGATMATVTWIGYQAPQWSEGLGANSVASDHAAQNGAAQLTPFLQGIGAAREHDAHLTVLGHSYGSTTAGLALQQDTGVDDVMFFGSPGLHTSHVEDLKVPTGHTYYIEARQDPVGDLGHFGIDPSHMTGIEHASAREASVVNPVTGETEHLTEVTGHSRYLEEGSTSQYNMAVVVAGMPDRRVYDSGQGAGDVLSWPVPGTY